MGFTKNKAWSIVIALIALIVFNIFAFAIPANHNIAYWMGYSFAVFANIVLVFTAVISLNKPNLKETFFGLPSLTVAWIYFIVQTILSILQMYYLNHPYFIGLIINLLLGASTIIVLILANMAVEEIKETDEKIAEKVFYIKNLQADIELLIVEDNVLAAKIKDLKETVRFSDPMSHFQLALLENKIINKFNLLKENIDNPSIASAFCDELQQLLAERSKKCRLLKGVAEPKAEKDNSGIGILAISFSILGFAVIFALFLIFIIIPNNKYNAAVALYESEKFEEAIIAFENLGTYKDSKVIVAEIKVKIFDVKYQEAELCYKAQEYDKAVKIYNELGDYKDSKDKIEQIHNKLASNGEIYFGMYQGKPIPWKILKTEDSRMLLITQNPVEELSFNNELKNITYETSTIRNWLNEDFLDKFSDEQKSRIIKSDEGLNDSIFLLTEKQYNDYSENLNLNTISNWWLRTKTDSGMMFVYGENSEVNTTGESVVRSMGVRPCVWISLN